MQSFRHDAMYIYYTFMFQKNYDSFQAKWISVCFFISTIDFVSFANLNNVRRITSNPLFKLCSSQCYFVMLVVKCITVARKRFVKKYEWKMEILFQVYVALWNLHNQIQQRDKETLQLIIMFIDIEKREKPTIRLLFSGRQTIWQGVTPKMR